MDLFQNKRVIFCVVSVLAIQLLIMIFLYGNNWYVEVKLGLPITPEYFITDNYPYELIFRESDSHLHIFSRIPFLISFFFDNFNTKNLLYVGWGLLSVSIYFLYLILKRTDEKIVWLVIPISAFVYNPIQYFTVLWAHSFFVYGIPFLSTVLIAYFLNKKDLDKKSYFISLSMGIVSSFSLVGGTLALFSGVFSLIYKKEKKKLVFWIVVISLVIITYVYVWSGKTTQRFLILPEKQIFTFLKLIALPYTVKLDFLYTILGLSMIILFIFSFIFLKKHYKLSTLLPWMQIAFVGFFASIMVTLGRGNVSYYYSTLTDLFAISLIGFVGLILVFLKQRSQEKKILKTIFVIMLVVQITLLIPSYYIGWKLANDFNMYETKRNSCFSLNPNREICDEGYYNLTNSNTYELLQIMNEFLKQKKGIFLNDSLNKISTDDQKFFYESLEKIDYSVTGYGKIEEINGNINTKTVITKEPLITISGWILDADKNSVDYLYILSNKKPLTKISEFNFNKDNSEIDNYVAKSTWKTSFLTGYLEDKCNEISIIGFKENKKIIIDDSVTICKDQK